MADHDRDELLKILESHGQQFLSSFALISPENGKRKAADSDDLHETVKKRKRDQGEEEFEEWNGFTADDALEPSIDGSDISDDEFTAETSTIPGPNVVVFSDPGRKSNESQVDKSQLKAFMSSKVSKLRQEESSATGSKKLDKNEENAELSNLQNDALLHRLVHTKLLSGSLNPELDLSGAERRKALEGRTLELAGKTKIGKGESAVRLAERNKAAKHVRIGIATKQKERGKKELEEAKNLGNYHPTLKKMLNPSEDPEGAGRKRERGIKMGVGRFQHGTLKLSREEISSVEGLSKSGRGGRGRGGRGGRGVRPRGSHKR